MKSPRLAARAVIVHEGRLLLVNAYPDGISDLWCAPGGGVMAGQDLPTNLSREVHEETGLRIDVGRLIAVNEFHDPSTEFHQVELFFRARIVQGRIDDPWTDPERVVTKRQFFTRKELDTLRLKPDILPDIAFTDLEGAVYDGLEAIVR